MRAIRCVGLIAIAACRIAGTHYIGLDGDDARDDGVLGPGGPAAYLLDASSGVYVLRRDTAGELTFTTEQHAMHDVKSSAIDADGKNLYVVFATPPDATSAVRRFKIAADGSLQEAGDTAIGAVPMNCIGDHAAVAPNGTLLAVGCSDAFIAVFPRMADGSLGAAVINETGGLNTPRVPQFSTDSACLFVADDTAMNSNVYGFSASSNGTLSDAINSPYLGPATPRGVAVLGSKVVVAGDGQIYAYTIKPNCELQLGNVGMFSDVAASIAITPAQDRIYIAGARVSVVATSTVSEIPGSPFLAPGSGVFTSASFDPSLPILYLTSKTLGGTMVGHVDDMGAVTQGTTATSPNTANAVWLQLAP